MRLLRDEPEGGRDAVHPGGGFSSAREAMQALLMRMQHWEAGSAWATFCVPGRTNGREDVMLELSENGQLNMLRDELADQLVLDLDLEKTGRGQYISRHRGPVDWAEVMDTVFRRHFGVSGDYPIHGRVQA